MKEAFQLLRIATEDEDAVHQRALESIQDQITNLERAREEDGKVLGEVQTNIAKLETQYDILSKQPPGVSIASIEAMQA